MFDRLTLRGAEGSVVWGGYRTAVRLKSWAITKSQKGWTLRGALAGKPDEFVSRQTPLMFAAPRPQGFWCWPVLTLRVDSNQVVVAVLGQPEQ